MSDPLPFSKEFLAQYDRLTRLGEGGMAVVFRAHDRRLDRPVAIKVLKALDAEQAARFRREGRVLAPLVHPHIMRVYDAGCDGDVPYLVCELIDGQPLSQLYHSGPPPVNDALRVTAEVASALVYAHERGIVHRDVKAENVLVTREGICKLADFGLARPVAAGHTITAADMVMGTPEYLAPELIAGLPPGPAADQYALGVLLYWLVSGVYPFTGTAAEQIQARVARDPEPPPSCAPVALEAAIMKMLARDPEARFASVAEASAAILRAAGSGPKTSPPARSRPEGRSRTGRSGAAAAMTRVVPARQTPIWRRLALPGLLAVTGLVVLRMTPVWRGPAPMTHGGSSPARSASPPPSPGAEVGTGLVTAVLRTAYRGGPLSPIELKQLTAKTGIDLGIDSRMYPYWFLLAEWIDGRTRSIPAFAGRESGALNFLADQGFVRGIDHAVRQGLPDLIAVAVCTVATNPGEMRPWLLLGHCLMLEDRTQAARRVFNHALTRTFACGERSWPPALTRGYLEALVVTGAPLEDGLKARVGACPHLARSAWVAVLETFGSSDPDRCERMLQWGIKLPGQAQNATAYLATFLLTVRGSYHGAVKLLDEMLAADPDGMDVRQKRLDLAWERGDRALAQRLVGPLMHKVLQHRHLPALLFPAVRKTPPPPLTVEDRGEGMYARNAYLVRLLEAEKLDDAASAYKEVGERFLSARPTGHRLDLYLHEGGRCPVDRAERLQAALAGGSDWLLWSELAGLVSGSPGGVCEKVLSEAGPGTPAELARALVASRRGQHGPAVESLEKLMAGVDGSIPPELALEIAARAIYGSLETGGEESEASRRARALPLERWAGVPGAMSGKLTALAGALASRHLNKTSDSAGELFLVRPEVPLFGFVMVADARLRRRDTIGAEGWVLRLQASARALAVNIWAISHLERVPTLPPPAPSPR